jgi:hypothetical protein
MSGEWLPGLLQGLRVEEDTGAGDITLPLWMEAAPAAM